VTRKLSKRVIVKKRLYKFLSALIFSLVLCFILFFIWVSYKPRYIPYISNKIETALNNLTSQYQVTSDDALSQWEGVLDGINVTVPHITVKHKEHGEVASFLNTKIRFNIFKALVGSFEIEEVVISGPEIKIDLEDYLVKSQRIIVGPPVITPHYNLFKEILSPKRENIPIKQITLEHARLIFNNGIEDVVWYVSDAKLRLIDDGDSLKMSMSAGGGFLGKEASMKSDVFFDKDELLNVRLEFSNLIPSLITDVLPEFIWLEQGDILLGGHILSKFNMFGKLNFSSFRLLTDEDSQPFIELNGSAGFSYNQVVDNELYEVLPNVKLNARVNNMPMEELINYWPPQFAPVSRNWVTKKIYGGTYRKGKAEIVIKPEDVINGVLSEDAINAEVFFENGKVRYFRDLPLLEEARGMARFNSNSMDLKMFSARFGESYIQEGGSVKISDIGVKGKTRLQTEGTLYGNIKDLISFYKLKAGSDKIDSFSQSKDISGKAKTDFTMSFPITKKLKPKDIFIEASARAENIDIPDVAEHFNIDLSDGRFSLFLNNDKMVVNGDANLNSTRAEISFNKYFIEDPDYLHKLTIKTYATMEEINTIGIKSPDFISGALGIDISITEKDDKRKIIGKFDAKDAEIDFPLIGYKKPAETEAVLSFSINDEGNDIFEIEGFQIISEGLIANGKGQFTGKDGEYAELYFEQIKFDENDFELRLTKNKEKDYRVALSGKIIDFSPALEQLAKPSSKLPLKSTDSHSSKPHFITPAIFSAPIELAIITLSTFTTASNANGSESLSEGLASCSKAGEKSMIFPERASR